MTYTTRHHFDLVKNDLIYGTNYSKRDLPKISLTGESGKMNPDEMRERLIEKYRTRGQAPKEQAPKEQAPKEQAPKEQAPKEQAQKEQEKQKQIQIGGLNIYA